MWPQKQTWHFLVSLTGWIAEWENSCSDIPKKLYCLLLFPSKEVQLFESVNDNSVNVFILIGNLITEMKYSYKCK